MDVKIIRAKQGLHVPVDPETTEGRLQMIATGKLALVHKDLKLPEGSFELLADIKSKKSSK